MSIVYSIAVRWAVIVLFPVEPAAIVAGEKLLKLYPVLVFVVQAGVMTPLSIV
jgi:hypothetical protein